MSTELQHIKFYNIAIDLLQSARRHVVQVVNRTMVTSYFELGRMIVEEQQEGKDRASYGKQLLKGLSEKLSFEFGKGFSVDNLENMRRFYIAYRNSETLSRILPIQNSETLSRNFKKPKGQIVSDLFKETEKQSYPEFKLSWSHYLTLMRMDDINERKFYEIESANNNWSVRTLKRQYDSALYTRLVLSRDKEGIKKLSNEGLVIESPQDAIKDPYILEFIGLPEKHTYSESEIEQKIIDKLEHFLLELGTGFSFVARQKRISFDDKHFRIDLVFYNRTLKSFVLIDLKIGELKHQDIGQMQMYVNYYDREIKADDENKTIGLILCKDKSKAVVEYTLPIDNKQIFASKYKTVLPSKEELTLLIK